MIVFVCVAAYLLIAAAIVVSAMVGAADRSEENSVDAVFRGAVAGVAAGIVWPIVLILAILTVLLYPFRRRFYR